MGCQIAPSFQDPPERLNAGGPVMFCIRQDESDLHRQLSSGTYGCALVVMVGNYPSLSKALEANGCAIPRQITTWHSYIWPYNETERSSPRVSGAWFQCKEQLGVTYRSNHYRLNYVRQTFKKL